MSWPGALALAQASRVRAALVQLSGPIIGARFVRHTGQKVLVMLRHKTGRGFQRVKDAGDQRIVKDQFRHAPHTQSGPARRHAQNNRHGVVSFAVSVISYRHLESFRGFAGGK